MYPYQKMLLLQTVDNENRKLGVDQGTMRRLHDKHMNSNEYSDSYMNIV